MAMEVAQSISKVASNLLEVKNLSAWKDLPSRLRTKLITSFISTLQQFLLILPRTIANDREVSLSSPNLCKFFYFISIILKQNKLCIAFKWLYQHYLWRKLIYCLKKKLRITASKQQLYFSLFCFSINLSYNSYITFVIYFTTELGPNIWLSNYKF